MKIFGLLGRSLSHSFSRDYFLKKWKDAGEESLYDYQNLELTDIRKLPEMIQSMPDLCGFNVTIPYKEAILPYCTLLSEGVRQIGAANTILVHRKGNSFELEGFNTDIDGFKLSLLEYALPAPRKAMILGTGGASRAVQFVLNSLSFEILLVSRNPHKGISYHQLNERAIQEHTLIINTTPLGMYPDVLAYPDIPYQYLQPAHRLIDLIYNPTLTIFLKKGEAAGSITQNGMKMLVGQAESAWKLFLNLE